MSAGYPVILLKTNTDVDIQHFYITFLGKPVVSTSFSMFTPCSLPTFQKKSQVTTGVGEMSIVRSLANPYREKSPRCVHALFGDMQMVAGQTVLFPRSVQVRRR